MIKGRAKMYQDDREKGLTYREIAAKYGVTYQAVACVCGKNNPNRFRYHTEKGVVYPNLRTWLNDNKVSVKELTRRLDIGTYAENCLRTRGVISGKTNPRKDYIDRLIAITGLTYEELFAERKEIGNG